MRSGGGGRLYGQPARPRATAETVDVAERTRQVDALARGTSLIPAALSSERLSQALRQLHAHYAQESQQRPGDNCSVPSPSLSATTPGAGDLLSFSAPSASGQTASTHEQPVRVTDIPSSSRSQAHPQPQQPQQPPARSSVVQPLSNYALRGVPSPGQSPPDVNLPVTTSHTRGGGGGGAANASLTTSANNNTNKPPQVAVAAPAAASSKPTAPGHMPVLFGAQTSTASPADTSQSTASAAADAPFTATSKDVLSRCGLPTAERVRSVFAAAEAHSELGAMLQWFAASLVRLFTEGLAAPSVLSFAENWERQMAYVAGLAHTRGGGGGGDDGGEGAAATRPDGAPQATASLNAFAFELQGVPTLFTYVWAQLAALEAATTQATTSQTSLAGLAKKAAARAAAAAPTVTVVGASPLGTLSRDGRQGFRGSASLEQDGTETPGETVRRRTMPFSTGGEDSQDGSDEDDDDNDDDDKGRENARGAHRSLASGQSPRASGGLGVATFGFQESQTRTRLKSPVTDGSGRLPSPRDRQAGAPSTELAPAGGPTRQFASTAHAFSRVRPLFHTAPQEPAGLWSSSVPAPAAPASRRSPTVRSASAYATPNTTTSSAEKSARSLTFHEMELQERRAKLQRELGVKTVHSYGAERDVTDYMRNMDSWREELMGNGAPSATALLVSSTGAPRTLTQSDPSNTPPVTPPVATATAPITVNAMSSNAAAMSSSSSPPSPPLKSPLRDSPPQQQQLLVSHQRPSSGSSPRTPPLAPVSAPPPPAPSSDALNVMPLQASRARITPRTSMTTATPNDRIPHAPSRGLRTGSVAAPGSRARSSSRTAPAPAREEENVPGLISLDALPDGDEETTGRKQTSTQPSRRRRDWLDPLVMANSSATQTLPSDVFDGMTDDDSRMF